jgi:peptide/nickel transport system substrate-binding protein
LDLLRSQAPYLERLVVKYVPDLTVLYTQFQTGDIDYIGLQGITPDHYDEAKTLKNRVVTPVPQAFIENIGLNTGKPVFKDPAVREALYWAMDKKSIIEQIYYGLPTPTESYLPMQSWAFNPDLPKQSYDPEKAKKILDDAGWKPGADGIREKGGVRLEFTNSTTAGNHVREQAQQLLQQNWADIGAKMTISNLPPAVMWGDYWMLSKFDSAMVGIDFMVGPDPDATDYFSSRSIAAKGGGGQNTCQYESPIVDSCLAEGAATVDQAKRKAAYFKMQEQTRKDLPYLPIFQYAMVQGVKSSLQGFAPDVSVQENCYNANTWYWA